VLVQDNGSYRLERLFRAKTELYAGSLDSTRVEQLRAMLANDRLRKLSQDDIHKPLITDTYDNVQLAIWRDQGWQELAFISPGSRKPFKESVDPLLHWFQDLQKRRPAAAQVEGPPTRCMPPTMQIAVRVAAPEAARGAAAAVTLNYLFRFQSRHFIGGRIESTRVESTCTIVFADGSYHWEKSDQRLGGQQQERIAGGHLEPEAIQELRSVLSSPDLTNSPGSPDSGNSLFYQEGSLTVLSIPRDSKVQNLIFSTAFNTLGDPLEIGGKSNLRYRVSDEKLLEPLKRWMKGNTDAHWKETEKTAVGNDCAAVKNVATAEKSSD